MASKEAVRRGWAMDRVAAVMSIVTAFFAPWCSYPARSRSRPPARGLWWPCPWPGRSPPLILELASISLWRWAKALRLLGWGRRAWQERCLTQQEIQKDSIEQQKNSGLLQYNTAEGAKKRLGTPPLGTNEYRYKYFRALETNCFYNIWTAQGGGGSFQP